MIELAFTGRLPAGLRHEDFQEACMKTLRAAKAPLRGIISIAFITDEEMRKLNRQYRKKDKSTDVLSFPEPEIPGIARQAWGDIFISPTYVRAEADRRGIALSEEILRMVIHGVLHLLGYDHITEEQEFEMFSLQEKVLAKVLPI